jgi:hypothetical protein
MHPMIYFLHTQSDSARACRRCRAPIKLSDSFGLSEGVCPGCRGTIATIGDPPPLRSLAAWLRRAA